MTRDGTVGRSDATEPNLAVHRDIDPVRMMRTRFADPIRASSPPGLHQQAGHMTASDFCAARYIFSCQAGAIHTCPAVALIGITQDRRGMPSRCTVHAPQRATPQPNLVPFMPRRSRKTHSNGMSGDASTVWDLPLMFNVTMIDLPHSSREMVDIDPSDGGPSLPKGSVVRHSKIRVSMTAMGQKQKNSICWDRAASHALASA